MRTVVPVVEGDGEVAAVPILLRRLGEWLSPDVAVAVSPRALAPRPQRVLIAAGTARKLLSRERPDDLYSDRISIHTGESR